MLVARRTSSDTHFLCPYCGNLYKLDEEPATRDHIVARAQWREFRHTTRYKESLRGFRNYPNPENDPKNLIYCCFRCNRIKSDMLYIPNWSASGRYRLWGNLDLKVHAQYFYSWVDTFIEYFARRKGVYPETSWDNHYVLTNLDKLYEFKRSYEERLREDHWYIDDP